MRKRLPVAAGILALVLTLRGESEDAGGPLKPGAEHARLKALAGSWDLASKFAMMPGTEPVKGKGTCENTLVLGGKYLQSVATQKTESMGSEMMATFGYNLYLKKYFYIFFIAETGGFVVSEGNFDKDGKVLTMEGAEELPDGQEMKVKVVIRIVSDEEHVMEFWFPGEGGKLFLAGEYAFTRKK
jgi:hypothetical protein